MCRLLNSKRNILYVHQTSLMQLFVIAHVTHISTGNLQPFTHHWEIVRLVVKWWLLLSNKFSPWKVQRRFWVYKLLISSFLSWPHADSMLSIWKVEVLKDILAFLKICAWLSYRNEVFNINGITLQTSLMSYQLNHQDKTRPIRQVLLFKFSLLIKLQIVAIMKS